MIETVGVAGVGVVGGALASWLRSIGYDVAEWDPPAGKEDRAALRAQLVFVCTPTPWNGAGCDVSSVREVVASVEAGSLVCIRSTVPPGTTEALQAEYPRLKIFFAPEFLTESRALQDMFSPARSVVGYVSEGDALRAREILALLPPAPFALVTRAREAEAIKYASNAFYALKVSWANQLYDYCRDQGINYDVVRHAAAADPMTGGQHLDVHHGGYRGFGGKCLPKDANALVASDARQRLKLLREAVAYNEQLKATPA